MKIHVVPAGPIATNAYLLTNPASREAVLIDAPEGVWADVEALLQEQECELKELWITHGHWDHMQGAAEIVRQTGVPVRAHIADRNLLETPETMAFVMNMTIEPVKITHWVAQGEKLKALGREFEVRHVPGHCPGNVLFHDPVLHVAFVGDALFNGSVGRTDLPGGDFSVLERSIRTQIYTLPDATVVYPGHGDETSVGAEKRTNPFVKQA